MKTEATHDPDAALYPIERIDMLGGCLEFVGGFGGAQDPVLLRTRIAPGQGVPLHSHGDPECFFVLDGVLDVFFADSTPRWHRVEAGRSMLAADGIRHAIHNPGDRPTELIVMVNDRLARFFREAGRPAGSETAFRPPGPEDIERVTRVAKAYGYWLASPAESAAITGPCPTPSKQ